MFGDAARRRYRPRAGNHVGQTGHVVGLRPTQRPMGLAARHSGGDRSPTGELANWRVSARSAGPFVHVEMPNRKRGAQERRARGTRVMGGLNGFFRPDLLPHGQRKRRARIQHITAHIVLARMSASRNDARLAKCACRFVQMTHTMFDCPNCSEAVDSRSAPSRPRSQQRSAASPHAPRRMALG